ncbi:hypothetical protein DFJ63DRAFT_332494 [Scheffersomyces coipomensis]|uniref:uncharacterized protein n=1 Tax=Scheffersomyces coipomensis TaxID=1788519 RepID=UPI00315C9ED4
MPGQLDLRASELLNIETSWSQVENKVNYQRIDFISRIYSTMISNNRKFRSIFNDDLVLNHHIAIFSDLLNFSLSYLNEPRMLDEFMYQFNIENAIFTSVAVTYLEEMGPAIISTLKEYLPDLSAEVETSWVKLYVYIANSLLQYSDSDDEEEEMEDSSEDMVAPLNINRSNSMNTPITSKYEEIQEPQIQIQRPQPRITKPSSILDPSKSIQFLLNSNEKYKGFRRSVEYETADPIQVEIPQMSTFQKVHQPVAASSSNMSASLRSMLTTTSGTTTPFITPPSTPFDPRKTRRGIHSSASSIHEDHDTFVSVPALQPVVKHEEEEEEEEEVFTPVRSSRRNSSSEGKKLPEIPSLLAKLEQHQQSLISSSSEDEDYEEATNSKPIEKFDPRSRKGHKRSNSVHIPSPESSEVDEQEEFEYMRNDNFREHQQPAQINIEPPTSVPERSLSRGGLTGGTFDYNSFGLKGLAPIVEADFDDNASSKYGDNEDGNSTTYGGDESNKSVTDEEDTSSRNSSLSLHNSDYKSSISSGAESANSSPTTDLKSKFSRQAVTGLDFNNNNKVQQPAYRSQIQQHYQVSTSTSNLGSLNRNYCSSTPSLLMGKSGDSYGTKRASMGFMRSSFVLKKEMETLGYNVPENVSMTNVSMSSNTVKRSSPPMASTSNFSEQYNQRASTTISLPRNFNSNKFRPKTPVFDEDDSFDMLNSFSTSTNNKNNNNNGQKGGLNYKSRVIEPPAKLSFKQRLSSFFGSSSSSSTRSSTSTASTSRSASSTSSTGMNSNNSIRTSSTRATSVASASSAGNIPRRTSASPMVASSGYSMTSKMSHPSVMSDNASINTVDTRTSSKSRFSLFSKKSKDVASQYRLHGSRSRKGGKYKVQSTPYDLELFRKGHNI